MVSQRIKMKNARGASGVYRRRGGFSGDVHYTHSIYQVLTKSSTCNYALVRIACGTSTGSCCLTTVDQFHIPSLEMPPLLSVLKSLPVRN